MMRRVPDGVSPTHPAVILGTWFYAGLLRPAPGTWGSAAAVPFGLLIAWLGGWPALLAGGMIAAFIGVLVADVFARLTGLHDWGGFVLDEVAGQWLALVPAALDWRLCLIAFLGFRLLDAAKPGPIGWLDRHVAGGLGVVADDVLAGVLTALGVAAIAYWTGWGIA